MNHQDGEWHVTRRIVLPSMDNEFIQLRVDKIIDSLEEVELLDSSVKKKCIEVRYDVRSIFYSNMIKVLTDSGYVPKNNIFQRLRSQWLEFIEDNMRRNAKAPATSCCNKPPIRPKH